MKKLLMGLCVSVSILGVFCLVEGPKKVWADVSNLTMGTGVQAQIDEFYSCTVNQGNVVPNTCSPVGVNWSSLLGYMETNINWQDLPGVTGAPTSATTWLKAGAP